MPQDPVCTSLSSSKTSDDHTFTRLFQLSNARVTTVHTLRRLGRYRRWSIRVSSLTLAQITQLALSEGWEISDLTRALIVFAATATWLALANQKNVDVLREIAALGQMRSALEKSLRGKVQRRPYPIIRSEEDTDVATLILPYKFAELLESFAAAKMVSKNDLCRSLLTKGLLLYLTGEKRLLETLQSQRNQKASRSGLN